MKIPEPFADSELTTILVVDDLERSTGFYVNMLGAYLFREYGGDSVVLDFLGNWLLLVQPGGPTEDKPDIYFETSADRDHVSQAFTIRVKNCRQSYEILKRRGVEFITAPYDRGQETRCFFRDPDGHLFEISEYRNE